MLQGSLLVIDWQAYAFYSKFSMACPANYNKICTSKFNCHFLSFGKLQLAQGFFFCFMATIISSK
uniref:Phosphatidylinositol N-acetylglucosaminyltransferase subunit P n=1 Tax=Rhizophora mucronata TaxID=61149 RepID=A0A2P2JJR2_RHIMU